MCVSHAPLAEASSDLPEAIDKAVSDVLGRVGDSSSLAAMVLVVVAGLREVGVLIVRHALERRDEPYRRGEALVDCPHCGGHMQRRRKLRPKGRCTDVGKVVYKRCQYECFECGHRLFPLDDSLQLRPALRGHDEGFANKLVLMCTVVPFGKGCDLFCRMTGIKASTQLARALTFTIGTRLYEAEMARADALWLSRCEQPELFEPPPAKLRQLKRHKRVYVMTDNSKIGIHQGTRGRHAPQTKMLRKIAQQAKGKAIAAAKRQNLGPESPPKLSEDMQALLAADEDSWRDVRALLIFSESDLATTSNTRRQILHRRVIGHVGTKDEWMRLVHLALHEEGVYTAHEVVIVADGGRGIWELFAELLPTTATRRVVQILDWFHAAQKLWAIGRALKGSKTPAQRKACNAWVKQLLDYLAEGKVSNVLQRLRKVRKIPAAAAKTLENGIDYFVTHRRRMHYRDFRNRRMLIGSGAIESVHAWVFQPRCRLPGMRWSVAGANAMIRLRCSWASDRWDDDFAQAANAPPLTNRKLKIAA